MSSYTDRCRWCGAEFEARNTRARYCSDAHRVAAWRVTRRRRDAARDRELEALRAAVRDLRHHPA